MSVEQNEKHPWSLGRSKEGRLELSVQGAPYGPICADLSSVEVRSSAARSRRQPLARAVGLARSAGKVPRVCDATAGLGGDSWLLAALGCEVIALERSETVFSLLADGLERARAFAPEICDRIQLLQGDALEIFANWSERNCGAYPDVVYLDPMFPPKKKKAALERKEMRALRSVVGEDTDTSELFEAALKLARQRVVVKRPLHAESLVSLPAVQGPTVLHKGKSMRYDVYVQV
ncbi:MAG: class I SAM-dependent methyltransferase [Deltaproteobacteria bacterium]|nr:class I SAM-dependent methyltransferase [Deltaproteobacteria bacterium]